METSIHPDKQHPNRVIVSLALVHSELYWFCSVLFCIFQTSGLLTKPSSNQPQVKRVRAHSEPVKPKAFRKEDFVTLENEEQLKKQHQRRFSLPNDTIEIRKRPSTKDELTGTTCPPIWWQKTRVKLGHAPVHGDPKPRSIKSTPSSTSPSLINVSPSPSPSLTRIASNSPKLSQRSMTGSSTVTDVKPTLLPVSNTSTRSSTSSIESTSNISLNQRQSTKNKFVSKLNSALNLRSRKNDSIAK